MPTVRLYFRNIMLFVHRDDGTDVWFMRNHGAHVITRDKKQNLQGTVIQLFDGTRPVPSGNMSIDMPRVIDLDRVTPGNAAKVIKEIKNAQNPSHLVARLELPRAGSLRDLPSLHAKHFFLDWHTPVAGKGESHVQRLTELAVYEVGGVADPVLVVQDPNKKQRVELHLVPSPGEDEIAEALFVATERRSKSPKLKMSIKDGRQELRIREFVAFHECYDDPPKSGLKTVIPTAYVPEGIQIDTAEPYCPIGQLHVPGTSRGLTRR